MKSLEDIINVADALTIDYDYDNINNVLSPDLFLFSRWAYRIEKGWYGFALGNVPFSWAMIINSFLLELEIVAPNFKIHQIKLKFGGLRFDVDLNLLSFTECNLIRKEILKLENLLFSEKLIY